MAALSPWTLRPTVPAGKPAQTPVTAYYSMVSGLVPGEMLFSSMFTSGYSFSVTCLQTKFHKVDAGISLLPVKFYPCLILNASYRLPCTGHRGLGVGALARYITRYWHQSLSLCWGGTKTLRSPLIKKSKEKSRARQELIVLFWVPGSPDSTKWGQI